jgi:hypothetical protein
VLDRVLIILLRLFIKAGVGFWQEFTAATFPRDRGAWSAEP